MAAELPDFHIPHAEKIEWMIETNGWALEPVSARTDVDPPVPGYAYTIGFPAAFDFPEVLVFGLTPVATNGLMELVADMLRGGTQIPLGVELVAVCVGHQMGRDAGDLGEAIDLDEVGVGPRLHGLAQQRQRHR